MYCRSCGKALREQDLFCPHCGTAVRGQLPPSPAYPCEVRKKDRTLVIVAVVVMIAVVLPMLLSGLLYLMVMGPGPSGPSPSVRPIVSKPSADVIRLEIAGTSAGIGLADVWMDVRSPEGQFGIGAGHGLDVGNSSMGGIGSVTVTFYDKDADKMLSDNDQIVVRSTLGPLERGQYEIRLLRSPDGAMIAKAVVTVP